jgi:hypothetical protein
LQVAGVLLLDHEDVLERAAQAVLLQHLRLADPLPIAGDRVELAVEVLLEHRLRIGREMDVGDVDGRHPTEEVDLVRQRDGVLVLFVGVHGQLGRDGVVLRSRDHGGVLDVLDQRRVLLGEILVEEVDELGLGHAARHRRPGRLGRLRGCGRLRRRRLGRRLPGSLLGC